MRACDLIELGLVVCLILVLAVLAIVNYCDCEYVAMVADGCLAEADSRRHFCTTL